MAQANRLYNTPTASRHNRTAYERPAVLSIVSHFKMLPPLTGGVADSRRAQKKTTPGFAAYQKRKTLNWAHYFLRLLCAISSSLRKFLDSVLLRNKLREARRYCVRSRHEGTIGRICIPGCHA